MSAPAKPCPQWCTRQHDPHDAMQSHHHVRPVGKDVQVSLIQTDYGDHTPDLGHFNGQQHIHLLRRIGNHEPATMLFGLDETGQLLKLLALLGREDISVAVAELVAISRAEAAGDAL